VATDFVKKKTYDSILYLKKLLACLLINKIYHRIPNGRNNFFKEFIKICRYLQLYICNTYYSIKLITPNNNVCLYSILFSGFLITMWYKQSNFKKQTKYV
jgi:predicted membrane channel-forming protein YqfA (hemolysin III family)